MMTTPAGLNKFFLTVQVPGHYIPGLPIYQLSPRCEGEEKLKRTLANTNLICPWWNCCGPAAAQPPADWFPVTGEVESNVMPVVSEKETHHSSAASIKSPFYLPKREGDKYHLIPVHTVPCNEKTPIMRPLCQADHVPPYSHLPQIGTHADSYLTCPHLRD